MVQCQQLEKLMICSGSDEGNDGVEESKEKERDENIDISEDSAQQTTESSQNCKSNFTPTPATR